MTPSPYQISVLARPRVVAERVVVACENLGDDGGAVSPALSAICRAGHVIGVPPSDPRILIIIIGLETVGGPARPQQRHAASGHDALGDGGAGRVHGIAHPVLLFPDFEFGRAADPDHSDAAG